MFVKCLLEVHSNKKQEALIWLKQNIDPATCVEIFRDYEYNHTFVDTMKDRIEDRETKLKSCIESVCKMVVGPLKSRFKMGV